MAIVPWRRGEDRSLVERTPDPFSYLRNQINRVFDDFWGESLLTPRHEIAAAGFWPQVDVTETDKEIKVSAEIPGVEAKDIDVTVEDSMLTIKGEKKYEREEKEKGQYRMERSYGSFRRAIELPAEVDESKAKAEFKKGVLRLTLPKRPGAQSRRKKIAVT
ncbi:MAG: Hsp20/alpha crystallin family protein [Verrucomicrobia bacterium]|nr:Hsp20/alpha crystallin family protein [Verrucomicrobiota bacterium]